MSDVTVSGVPRLLSRLAALDRTIQGGIGPLVAAALEDDRTALAAATHRSPDNPANSGRDYVHTQDAYFVHMTSRWSGVVGNSAPQFFAQVDVPEQDIHGNPLHFFAGETSVFSSFVHFPGPNQELLAAIAAQQTAIPADLRLAAGAVFRGK